MENETLLQNKSQILHSGKMWSVFRKYHRIEVIAAANFIIFSYGLYLTFEDIFAQYYPSSLHEAAVLFFYYSFLYALIGGLLIGHIYKKPLFYLPWMATIHIILAYATYLWIKNIMKYGMFYDTSAFFKNLMVLGIGWLSWTLVSLDFITRYSIVHKNQEIINNKNAKET